VRVEDAVVPERGEESGGAMLRQVLPLAAGVDGRCGTEVWMPGMGTSKGAS
jgi:hypothetical protein